VSLQRWSKWLPLVPLAAGAAAFGLLALRHGDEDSPIEIHSDATVFTSLGGLVGASDLIVVADVTAEAPGRAISSPTDPDAAVSTRLLSLHVAETIRGDAADSLTMEEIARTGDGVPIEMDGQPASEVGERLLLFLVRGDQPGVAAIVNGQGRYVLSASDQIVGPPSLVPVDWTLDELRRLAAACERAGTCEPAPSSVPLRGS
jgi:hypothetical protein